LSISTNISYSVAFEKIGMLSGVIKDKTTPIFNECFDSFLKKEERRERERNKSLQLFKVEI
jgi:hypothetical protein